MILYLSGPMTGEPNNNKPMFDLAANHLRAAGHTVYSPVELDEDEGADLSGDGFDATDEEYEQFLSRDLALIERTDLDGIALLPRYWVSGGAGREGRRAIERGLKLYAWDPAAPRKLWPVSPEQFLDVTTTERRRQENVVR